MKKTIPLLLICFTALLAAAANLYSQPYSNILRNGDFEDGLANWTERKCTMTLVDTPVVSGAQAVLVSDRTKVWAGPAQSLTDSLLAYGQGTYIVSAYYRTAEGEDTAKVQIKMTLGDEKIYNQINTAINSTEWTLVSDTLLLTWDGAAVLSDAALYLQTKVNQSISYYVDNISIVPDSVVGGGGGDDSTIVDPGDPIAPHDYVNMLGKGFDAGWSEFNKLIASYNEQMVKDIKAAGFDHVRLRTGKNADADLFGHLDRQVLDCLKNDVIPIIAYQGHDAEEDPSDENRDALIAWWRSVAEHYKDYSHKVAFNILVEISGALSDQPDKLNDWYEMIVAAIREVSPTRLIIISPVGLSNPFNLSLLRIPLQANGYLFAEWHFYAAGPSKTSAKKLWTTGTDEEKKLIADKIAAALAWQDSTGLPTWVGAWMPGNYNKGDDYTVPEQVRFASFMVRSLETADIPWAVNAVKKFYDAETNRWLNFRLPVRDVMLDPDAVALYGQCDYGGDILRLAPGRYDAPFLQEHGFLNQVGALMIPMDFRIAAYSQAGFSGQERLYTWSDSCLTDSNGAVRISSLVVARDTTTTVVREGTPRNGNVTDFCLKQNYPNPFNPATTIEFSLACKSRVVLQVFNLLGRLVATVVDRELDAGVHKAIFDVAELPSGVYIYRMEATGVDGVGFVRMKKMARVK